MVYKNKFLTLQLGSNYSIYCFSNLLLFFLKNKNIIKKISKTSYQLKHVKLFLEIIYLLYLEILMVGFGK